MEEREAIADAIRGANMLFITTGMGGGTGTGASPVVAEVAQELGILTVAVVTRPFEYEGKRIHIAQQGIEHLKGQVDSLIVILNDKLMTALGEDATLKEAFEAADNVLHAAVAGIAEVVTRPGFINLDFADVKNVMSIKGMAMMGSGASQGIDRARLATEEAIQSPLLDNVSLDGARGVLVNITTAPGCLKMSEYREIMRVIDEYAHPDSERKYGTAEDENMPDDAIRVTIIATGLKEGGGNPHVTTPIRSNSNSAYSSNNPISNRPVSRTENYVVEDNSFSNMESSFRSGRSARSTAFSAADFDDQAVRDNFETPAMLRRGGGLSTE